MHIRCPHCANPIEVLQDESFSDVECPSCGSHFHMLSDTPSTQGVTPSKTLAHFELLERVGIGGFGTVWKARDTELDREVALKIPRQSNLDEVAAEQFFREARAAAQLKHPNIVSVHEVGRADESIYIVSDFIDGVDLGAWIRANKLSPRESAELCRTVAGALQHAHESGIIHRDLKPSNILLDGDLTPYLADFGLAKRETGEITVTLDGRIVGTPAYMSPEQARGQAHDADARSDVYSAGVILYELLTGQRPFRGEKRMLIFQILNDDPISPRRLDSSIPVDLETICLKCMEKDPDRRYESARELADDLDRYLAGRPIQARPLSVWGRAARWSLRNPAIAGLLGAIMGILLLATCVSTFFAWQSNRNAARADQRKAEMTDTLYDSLSHEIRLNRMLRKQGYGDTIREKIRTALSLDTSRVDRDDLRRQFALSMGDFVAYPPTVIENFPADVSATCLSADASELLVGMKDGTVAIYDPKTTEQRALLTSYAAAINAVAFLPGQDQFVVAVGDGTAHIWQRDGTAWRQVNSIQMGESPGTLITSDQGEMIGFLKGSTFDVWEVASGTKVRTLATLPGWTLRNAAFDVKNRKVAAGYVNKQTDTVGWALWDLDSGERLHNVEMASLGQPYSNSIAIGNDGRQLAIGFDEALLLYDLRDNQRSNRYGFDSTKAVAFSPENRYLAAVSIRGRITIWNATTNREFATLSNPRRGSSRETLSFSLPGTHLIASNAHVIRVWDLTKAGEKTGMTGHAGGLPTSRFSKNGQTLISGGKDDFLRFWHPQQGTLLDRLQLDEAIQALAVIDDGKHIVVGCMGKDGGQHLRIVDTASKSVVYTTSPAMKNVHSLAAASSDSGEYVAACGAQGVALWKVSQDDSLTLEEEMSLPRDWCLATDISRDAKWMIWAQHEQLYAWDIANKSEIKLSAPAMLQGWHGVNLLPDGDSLIYVSESGNAEIWSLSKDRRVDTLGAEGEFRAPHIALSPNGIWFAALTDPETVSIWHTKSLKHAYSLRPEGSTVWSISWSPDSERVAVGRSDGSLSVWHLERIQSKLATLGLQSREY